MYTLFGIKEGIMDAWESIKEAIRGLVIIMDSIAFSVLEKAYDLFAALASETLIDESVVSQIRSNMYVIVGIFAFFRIAMLLINAIISPDTLSKQGAGLSKVAVNTVIMIALLVVVPVLFGWSRDLSKEIVDGNYIQQLFTGAGSSNKDNPGGIMERVAVSGIILPYDKFVEDLNTLKPSGECDDTCKPAVYCLQEIKDSDKNNGIGCLDSDGNVNWDKLAEYNKAKVGDTYVYNYRGLILTIAGWFMAYVLLSFSFDVAKRMVELAVLEITAPLFIATIVDPKSMSSGTFSKWLKAVGTSYASLFVRQAGVAILILCAQLLIRWQPSDLNVGTFGKFIVLIGILIFVKGAPQWLSKLVGVDASGMGGLSLKKKLASAALIGGITGTSAYKYASQKGKNFAANRLRNTSARVGASNEARRSNRELKQQMKESGSYDRQAYRNARKGLWKEGRKAAIASQANNFGKDAQGILNDIGAGYLSGRLKVNGEAQTLRDKYKNHLDERNKRFNDEAEIKKREEFAKKAKDAKGMYEDVAYSKSGDGDRLKVKGPNGKDVYLNPVGDKEINESLGNPTTEYSAYSQHGKNLVNASGGKLSIDSSGRVVESDSGKIVANSAAEYGIQNMTYSGKLAVKSTIATNVSKDVANYQQCLEQIKAEAKAYSSSITAYNEVKVKLMADPEYSAAQVTIESYNNSVKKREDAGKKILEIKNSKDYSYLTSKPSHELTVEEQKRLASYNMKIKSAISEVNDANSEIKKKQKDYNNAESKIDQIESATGIAEMKNSYESAEKRLNAWRKEAEKYENKFKVTEGFEFDDKGNIKTTKENPYVVTIDGHKYNPSDKDALIKFEEIKNILNSKASKAREEYENSKITKGDKK